MKRVAWSAIDGKSMNRNTANSIFHNKPPKLGFIGKGPCANLE